MAREQWPSARQCNCRSLLYRDELLEGLARQCARCPQPRYAFAEREGEPLSVRVGLNAGEPVEEEGDLFGATVIVASRVAAKAGPGEILIPEPVRHLLAGKGFLFSDRGDHVLKGFEDAMRLF